MDQRNYVKCRKCGAKFIPTEGKANVSAAQCGQQCPECGIWTPIPFQVYRAIGGKIPGEN